VIVSLEEGGNMNLIMRCGSSLVEYLSLHVRRNFKSPGCSTHCTYIKSIECFTTSMPLRKVGAPGEVVLSFAIAKRTECGGEINNLDHAIWFLSE